VGSVGAELRAGLARTDPFTGEGKGGSEPRGPGAMCYVPRNAGLQSPGALPFPQPPRRGLSTKPTDRATHQPAACTAAAPRPSATTTPVSPRRRAPAPAQPPPRKRPFVNFRQLGCPGAYKRESRRTSTPAAGGAGRALPRSAGGPAEGSPGCRRAFLGRRRRDAPLSLQDGGAVGGKFG